MLLIKDNGAELKYTKSIAIEVSEQLSQLNFNHFQVQLESFLDCKVQEDSKNGTNISIFPFI